MIDKLLEQIGEDKHQNPATTSDKFKRDLWEFYENKYGTEYSTCIEYGTHKGQTTRILSYLFTTVYTCNLPNQFDKAKQLNDDRDNINYIGIDLYRSDVFSPLCDDVIDLFFIDAVHTHEAVLSDFTRSISHKCADTCYFVFDDYGLIPEVKRAVDDLIWVGKIELVAGIGHEPEYDFKNGRKLLDWEGVICKLIKD